MTNPHDHLIIAMGLKPKPTAGGPPPSVRDRMMPRSESAPPAHGPMATGAKSSPEEAGFVTADQRCGDCANWERDTNSCPKVEGTMKCCDGCAKYFSPMAGGDDDATGMMAAMNPEANALP